MKILFALLTTSLLGLLSPAQASPPALPEAIGTVWRYKVEAVPADDPYDDVRAGTYELQVMNVERDGEKTVLELRELDSFTHRYRFSRWEQSAEGVTIRDVDFLGPLSTMIEGFALEFLKFPLARGSKHDDGKWITEIVDRESVRVPGNDEPREAWKLSVIGTHESRYTVVGYYWLVEGWGIVKSRLNSWGWLLESEATGRDAI